MTRLLPSLELIRGFESAARQLSFTKAAAELFVTQSAISRQVRQLEDNLGAPLFERRHREVRLTEAGQTLYRATRDALQMLNDAALRIRNAGAASTVTISCSIGFASLWLVPRLTELRQALPGLDLRISANNAIIDVDREGIELAIRYCPPKLAPAEAIRLFGEEVFPVCAPSLLRRRGKALATPDDLRNQVLLMLDDEVNRRPTGAWQIWLEAAHVHDFRPQATLHFSHYDQLIQAAVDGQGVALGSAPLVRRLIRQKALVAPFEQKFASPRAYFLVPSRAAGARPDVQTLIRWIVDSASAEP